MPILCQGTTRTWFWEPRSIECRRKVRQKPWIRPLNRKTRRKGSHDFCKLPWMAERRQFFENGGEGHARIGIQVHLCMLAWMCFQEIHLIQIHPDLHLRWIYDLQERYAGPDLVALLHGSHAAAQPNGVVDDNSGHGRVN